MANNVQVGSEVFGVSAVEEVIVAEEQQFKYKPLDTSVDSIRLLVLHGAPSQESSLSCSLMHTNFAECPNYEALSYEWGVSTVTKSLAIEGAQLPIGENLHEALMHIRLEKDCTLWIDAVCINQDDLSERQYQVGLMDFIYHRAERVLVWLGLPSLGTILQDDEETLVPAGPGKKNLEEFCTWSWNHTYWNRVWIVQEIALARKLTVCIGKNDISWTEYLETLKRHRSFKSKGEKIRKLDEKRRGRHGPSNRLEQLLRDFQYAECRETRDKIYGFLGLAHDCPPELHADYTKSLFNLYAEVLNAFAQPQSLPNGAKNIRDRMMRVVGYSRLIQRLLSPEIPQSLSSPLLSGFRLHIIRARGAVTHRILHLGPTRDRIVASIAANKEWIQSLGIHFNLPQDLQLLREANESYFPVIKEMKEKALKYRALDPRQLYSRGTLVRGRAWTNDEHMWSESHLAVPKAIRESEIAKKLEKELKSSFQKAVKDLKDLEKSPDPKLRPVSRSPSASRSRSQSRPRYDRYDRKRRSRSDSDSDSFPGLQAIMSELKQGVPRSILLGNNRQRSRSRARRSRSREDPRLRVTSISRIPSKGPENDVSMICFPTSETPQEPRLFLGDKGIIGLAPPEAEPGDILCQFWGTGVTALLRKEPQPEPLSKETIVNNVESEDKIAGSEVAGESIPDQKVVQLTGSEVEVSEPSSREYYYRRPEVRREVERDIIVIESDSINPEIGRDDNRKVTQDKKSERSRKAVKSKRKVRYTARRTDSGSDSRQRKSGRGDKYEAVRPARDARQRDASTDSDRRRPAIAHEEVREVRRPARRRDASTSASSDSSTGSDDRRPRIRREVRLPDPVYRIIGRVHLSTGYLKNLEPTYRKFNKPPDGSDCIDITMSIHTLAYLTS